MKKELKSCTDVLLRADPFWQMGLDGHALSVQPSKGHPNRILILFPQCSTTFLAPSYQKIGDIFISGLSHSVI